MRSFPLAAACLTLTAFALSCNDEGPTGPGTSDLELVVVRGDGQFGEPGSLLPVPLEVRVQAIADGKGREGVKVRWEVLEGMGALVDPETTLTDSSGLASIRMSLGSALGTYRVRASVRGMVSGPADFGAQAVLTPELTLVPDYPVRAGDTITLEGRNLSPVPEENVVTFSQVRGTVVSSSVTALTVEVPPCLPARHVDLRLQIGTLITGGAPLEVLAGDQLLLLSSGEDVVLDAQDGLACVRLPSEPGVRYLAVPHSTGTVGGAAYDFSFLGLTGEAESAVIAPSGERDPILSSVPDLHGPSTGAGLQEEWDARVRGLEADLRAGRGGAEVRGARAPADRVLEWAPVPAVGDRREFNVLNSDSEFDRVSARVRLVTDHTLIYVDEDAPGGGFSDADLAELAGEFDSGIHPAVTGTFGSESDVDGNDRVIILLTPAVNRLTPSGSESYVGGFFFGLDLMDRSGSNGGEVFYAVVPDPTGIHGPILVRSTLLYALPSVLAHEFGHMVHFNQRMLKSGADGQEALWLSEALAQMAEDLVGTAHEEAGDLEQARQFQTGNWARARRFLLAPGHVSVLATLPPGTLAERGAGWLLLKYLHGQDGSGNLLGDLAASTWTGVENVTRRVGHPWAEILSNWVGALYLDGVSVLVRPELRFLGLNLRYALSFGGSVYPLQPPEVGRHSFSLGISLWSSAPDYYIIRTPDVGGLAVNLSGPGGRPPEAGSGLRLLLVRLD